MLRKYSVLLALLISTNIIIGEYEGNFRRNVILFATVFTIISIALLPKIKSLITNHFNNSFVPPQPWTHDIKIALSNTELIFNGTETSQQNYSELPLIKASGVIKQLSIAPVEHVKVFGRIATIHINDAEHSRIEIDESFANNLIFSVVNGVLTVTTPDEQPRKFQYNGNPLCKIYAKLLTNKLIASDASDINVVEQKLNTIVSTSCARITGSIKPTIDLNFSCSKNAYLTLTNTNSENLIAECSYFGNMTINGIVRNAQKIITKDHSRYNSSLLETTHTTDIQASKFSDVTMNNLQSDILLIKLSDHSTAMIQGSTTQPEIIVSNFSIFNGSNLIGQGGCLNAQAYKHSKIFTAGNMTSSDINASNFSSINASQLKTNTAVIAINSHSQVKCGIITSNLSGSVNNFSTMYYKGNPWIKIKLDNFSKCKFISE